MRKLQLQLEALSYFVNCNQYADCYTLHIAQVCHSCTESRIRMPERGIHKDFHFFGGGVNIDGAKPTHLLHGGRYFVTKMN